MGAVIQMWPTPKASDAEMGMTARTTGRSIEKSTHLQTQVYLKEMFATPTAGDAQGSSGGNMRTSLRNDVSGQLNPDWVEWLMGLPTGWTNPDVDFLPEQVGIVPKWVAEHWHTEPDIPRIAHGIAHRRERLETLGNGVVPEQALPFMQAIVRLITTDKQQKCKGLI